jgi:hypothetical protein
MLFRLGYKYIEDGNRKSSAYHVAIVIENKVLESILHRGSEQMERYGGALEAVVGRSTNHCEHCCVRCKDFLDRYEGEGDLGWWEYRIDAAARLERKVVDEAKGSVRGQEVV